MKAFLLITVTLILCSGCMRSYYSVPAHDTLIDIPIPPHDREVAIIFPGESMPSEEYLKIGVVEVRGGEYTSYNTLIKLLQTEAQAVGVDAVQLFGKQQYGKVESDETFLESLSEAISGEEEVDEYATIITTTLSGLGIRYLKNMDYLSQYVKAHHLYLFNDTTQQYDHWEATAHTDFNKEIQSVEGNDTLYYQFRQYLLDYLRDEESDAWKYGRDEHQRIHKRFLMQGEYPVMKCWFTYQWPYKIQEVKIKHFPSKLEEHILFTYDSEHRLIEKSIQRSGQLFLRETLAYDERCLLAERTFFRVSKNSKVPYAKIKYEYHHPKEVLSALSD